MTRNYTTVKEEVMTYRRRNGIIRLACTFLAGGLLVGLLYTGYQLLGNRNENQQAPTVVYIHDNAPATDSATDPVTNNTQTEVTEQKADFEITDRMVESGNYTYTTVFRQDSGDNGLRRTDLKGNVYDYAVCPNRQYFTLDTTEYDGHLKGTFALSAFNKNTSYFREIEIFIYDVGNKDPFYTATMNSDTRNAINLNVKLAGHDKIKVEFGWAGGDVYLATNGLYISES